MTSIFSGTRFAFLVGEEPTKKKNYYADDFTLAASAASAQKAKGGNPILKAAWVLAGIAAILLPILYRNARMNRYQNNFWGQRIDQWNEAEAQDGAQFYDINGCKWYNFNCQPVYVDEKGNYVSQYEVEQEMYNQQMEQQQEQANQQYNQPSWYNVWDHSTEEDGPSGALKFVYIWEMIMFVGIVAYGYNILHNKKSPYFLMGALVIWLQFTILSMFLLSDGSIVTEDKVMEQTGFYGQFAVLMFITNASYAAFSLIFLGVLAIGGHRESKEPALEQKEVGDYQAFEPAVVPADNKSDTGDDYVKVV